MDDVRDPANVSKDLEGNDAVVGVDKTHLGIEAKKAEGKS